jgi:hypothetical protein
VLFEGNVGNGAYVFEAVGGPLTMTHGVFRRNAGGLLNLVDLDVTFTNNLVYDNTTPDNVTPAVNFYDATNSVVQLIMNNTVAENKFVLTALAVTGAGLFSSNIVADNMGTVGSRCKSSPSTLTCEPRPELRAIDGARHGKHRGTSPINRCRQRQLHAGTPRSRRAWTQASRSCLE